MVKVCARVYQRRVAHGRAHSRRIIPSFFSQSYHWTFTNQSCCFRGFTNEALRIGEERYIPTETDVLLARQKFTTIAETRFNMGRLSWVQYPCFLATINSVAPSCRPWRRQLTVDLVPCRIHIFDVNGQRSEQEKWIWINWLIPEAVPNFSQDSTFTLLTFHLKSRVCPRLIQIHHRCKGTIPYPRTTRRPRHFSARAKAMSRWKESKVSHSSPNQGSWRPIIKK